MNRETEERRIRRPWSTRKKDPAPRGVFRHPSGEWAVRFTCGAGHLHKEKVGRIKTDAVQTYHDRRGRALSEPGWCPQAEREAERARARAEEARRKARMRFKDYAQVYLEWSQRHKASWKDDRSRLKYLRAEFGELYLDEITPLQIERFRGRLLERRSRATANRYRDMLSGMFKRAIRDGHLTMNPVKTVSKFKENNERVTYLTEQEENAVLEALPEEYRPHFIVSLHTGLRWSEQINLLWENADFITKFITVPRSKNGRARRVPMNSRVLDVLLDLGSRRDTAAAKPVDPVFSPRPQQPDDFFPRAVARAKGALEKRGEAADHLDGYTWHCNRHTWASRLVMAGVDLLTVKELGGWRSLKMVERYAHLAPGYLHAAVERLVSPSARRVELARN